MGKFWVKPTLLRTAVAEKNHGILDRGHSIVDAIQKKQPAIRLVENPGFNQ